MITIDKIESVNAGTYANPHPAIIITGRDEDLRTERQIIIHGTRAENLEDTILDFLKSPNLLVLYEDGTITDF